MLTDHKSPAMVQQAVIGAKLAPPRISRASLSRPRLAFDRPGNEGAAMVTVVAPAGYGKTTLLRQWSDRLLAGGDSVAWLTLDRHDVGAAAFHRHVGAALGVLARLNSATVPSLAEALNALSARHGRTALFIDDLQFADRETADALLVQLAEYAPAGLRMFVASRHPMPFSTARLRAGARVAEYWASDLRFSSDEANHFLGGDPDVLSRLTEQARGWPAVLGLVRSSISRRHAGLGESVAGEFDECSARIEDYLSEVLSGLPAHCRNFLNACAVLDQFDQSLAETMTGVSIGAATLQQWRRDELINVDSNGSSYLMHGLLRSYLRRSLAELDPERLKINHRTAAAWYWDHDLHTQAVDHAVDAGDTRLTSSILGGAGGWRVGLQGGNRTLGKIARIGASLDRGNPNVELCQIYALVKDGREREARLALDDVLDALPGPHCGQHYPHTADARLVIDALAVDAVLSIYEERRIPPQSIGVLSKIIAQNPGLDCDDWAQFDLVRCYSAHQAGDWDAVILHGRQALRALERAHAAYGALFVGLYVGIAYRALGDFVVARATFETVMARAEERFGNQSLGVALARVFLAELSTELGNYAEAEQLLAESDRSAVERENWVDALAALHLANSRATEHRSGSAAALAYLHDQIRLAASRGQRRLESILACECATMAGPCTESRARMAVPETTRPDSLTSLAPWHDADFALAMGALGGRDAATTISPESAMRALPARPKAIDVKWHLVACAHVAASGDVAAAARLLEDLFARQPILQLPGRTVAALGGYLKAPLDALRHHLDPEIAITAAAAARGLGGATTATPEAPPLSARQNQILELLRRGFSTKEMAEALRISEGTVKVHRKHLYGKLDVHTRSGAIAAVQAVAG